MLRTLRLVLPAILLLSSCTAFQRLTGGGAPGLAGAHTLERDAYGVPLIRGATDAAVAFGLGYAQAEDDFRQLEEDIIRAIGRAANLYGDAELANDLVAAAFEIPRLSRAEYEAEPAERRRVWDSFVAGINHYVATHPEVRPRLLGRIEPWHLFALARAVPPGTTIDGVVLGAAAPTEPSLPAHAMAFARYDSTAARDEPGASIALAIAPARTENGRALLMHSLDRRFRAAGRPYEAHIRSQEGWQVSGYAMLGTPVMRSGIAPSHAWAHTESASDTRDAWVLAFDHPTDTLAYRHGSDWRRAEVFTDTIAVNTTSGVVRRPYRFLRTEYGPVVTRLEDGRAVAVQIARMREGGALQQWYAMNRANSLDGFRAALAHTALVGLNTMYADSSGRIYYVHGNAVPRRAAGVDPSALLDGSSATSAWDGYHRLEELPELLDPASGWIQSAAGTPFLATASGYNLERARYPSYMAPDGDTPRALQARRLLATEQDWTIEELETAAFDTHVPIADAAIRRLVDEYEQRGAVDPWGVLPLDHAVHQLREWDRTGAVESTAMTLFTTWQERLRSRSSGQQEEWPLTNALAWALERLERRWDRQDVAWGRVNRLTFPGTPQDGDSTGVALPGGPAWSGSLFGAAPITAGYGGERTLVSGISWSSVMEPGARARSWSFVVTGQSGDPASPHSSDQVRLLTERRMKPAADSAGWLPLRPPPQ